MWSKLEIELVLSYKSFKRNTINEKSNLYVIFYKKNEKEKIIKNLFSKKNCQMWNFLLYYATAFYNEQKCALKKL
jgi:hypothetical protein